MPLQAFVHRPGHVTRGPLGVRELPTQAAAILFEGPCAGLLPHRFPGDRCVFPMQCGRVCLHSAEIRPGPQHLLEVALLLGRQSLTRGLRVLQVAFQVLKAAVILVG